MTKRALIFLLLIPSIFSIHNAFCNGADLPTQEEAKKVCEFIANFHSHGGGTTEQIEKLYLRSGLIDINNDGQAEIVKGCEPTGTAGGDCFDVFSKDGKKLNIETVGFEWKNYWTFGQRILVSGGKTYMVHFPEERPAYPKYVTFTDRNNKEHIVCEFENKVNELVDNSVEDRSFCELLLTSKRPKFIKFDEPHFVTYKKLGRLETYPALSKELDVDNDGQKEIVIYLEHASGAGRGCDFEYFDLLTQDKSQIKEGKQRDTLLAMQRVNPSNRHPSSLCRGNETGWFVSDGVTFYESKYVGSSPREKSDEFHIVSFIKGDKIYTPCRYRFIVKTIVKSYFTCSPCK